MHKLLRRVARGLTLPLVVGAAVVLLASPSHATGQGTVTTVVTSSPTSVYGQEVHATAWVTDEGPTP